MLYKIPTNRKDIETLFQNNKNNIVNSVNLGQDLKIYEISQALPKTLKIMVDLRIPYAHVTD